MSVRFQLESGEVLEREETRITIGSAPSCQIVFENDRRVIGVHAVVRKMGNRWLIEGEGLAQVSVGDSEPAKRHWLASDGLTIRLTPNGPNLIFQPQGVAAPPSQPRRPTQSSSPSGTIPVGKSQASSGKAAEYREADRAEAETVQSTDPEVNPSGRKNRNKNIPEVSPPPAASVHFLRSPWIIALGVLATIPLTYFVLMTRVPRPGASPKEGGHLAPVSTEMNRAKRLEIARGATVWIGGIIQGDLFPLTTGILISPTEVTATAQYIVTMRDIFLPQKSFERFVVYVHDETGQKSSVQVEITGFFPHPKYSSKDPVGNFYDIGFLKLKTPVSAFAEPAPGIEQEQLTQNAKIELLGYPISSKDLEKFNPARAPLFSTYHGEVLSRESAPDEPQNFSTLVLKLTAPDGLDGGPILDEEGRLVAIVRSGSGNTRRAILASRLKEIPRP